VAPPHNRAGGPPRFGVIRVGLEAGGGPATPPMQNNSGLPQGPVPPLGGGGGGGTHVLRPQGGPAMSEQAVEERRRWASDIVWVVAYSILVLLVMLLWIYVPA